jgi:MacB-like periplasmic core domain
LPLVPRAALDEYWGGDVGSGMWELGYQFWQRYYSGDPAVVGRTLQLVRKNYQIVGVMPPRFRWREADIYMPLRLRLEPNIYFGVNLKIRPGVSTAEANAELQPILQEFATHTPGRYPDSFRVNLRSIIEMYARPMGPRLFLRRPCSGRRTALPRSPAR